MRRHAFITFGVLSVTVASWAMAQTPSRGTEYALLIAVGKYANSDQWKPLPYTIDEMKEFRAVLLQTGFAEENIIFLHDQQSEERLRPTRANVLKKLQLLLAEIGTNDTLVVALNGHGVQYKGNPTGYFCPVNADLESKASLVPMEGKEGIFGLLELCKAQRKLLLVNACRNDPTRELSFAAQKFELVDEDRSEVPKGIAALYSCKPGQRSYYYPEEEKKKRSLFYHHVIEAWQGKYAVGEKVTVDHVFDMVVRKTGAEARNLFDRPQIPWAKRKYEGDWVLAKAIPLKPALLAVEVQRLNGAWVGRYYYPASSNRASVGFNLDMTQQGRMLKAATAEHNTFWPFNDKISRNEPVLYANCRGSFDEASGQVNFMKTYDGTGGADHTVEYSGYLSRDGSKIEGTWTIRKIGLEDFTGSFTLQKSPNK